MASLTPASVLCSLTESLVLGRDVGSLGRANEAVG